MSVIVFARKKKVERQCDRTGLMDLDDDNDDNNNKPVQHLI